MKISVKFEKHPKTSPTSQTSKNIPNIQIHPQHHPITSPTSKKHHQRQHRVGFFQEIPMKNSTKSQKTWHHSYNLYRHHTHHPGISSTTRAVLIYHHSSTHPSCLLQMNVLTHLLLFQLQSTKYSCPKPLVSKSCTTICSREVLVEVFVLPVRNLT